MPRLQTTKGRPGSLIDPEAGTATANQVILIEGTQITAVGADVAIPDGAEVIDLGIAADRLDALDEALDTALAHEVDVLVTIGGASVGDHDLVQKALTGRGMALDFWKIAMRPGKPLMSGRLGDTPLIGLPGNPVSTLVCALLFIRPFLAALQGLPTDLPTTRARLAVDLRENDRREDYLRSRLTRDAEGLLWAEPYGRQDSSMLATLARDPEVALPERHLGLDFELGLERLAKETCLDE